MKRIVESMDRVSYQYHWFCIEQQRKRAQQLLDNGSSCTDPQLVKLSNHILQHGMRISRIWKRLNRSGGHLSLLQHELYEQVTV